MDGYWVTRTPCILAAFAGSAGSQFLRSSRGSTVLHAEHAEHAFRVPIHLSTSSYLVALYHATIALGRASTSDLRDYRTHGAQGTLRLNCEKLLHRILVNNLSGWPLQPKSGPSMNTTLPNLRASKARHRSVTSKGGIEIIHATLPNARSARLSSADHGFYHLNTQLTIWQRAGQ